MKNSSSPYILAILFQCLSQLLNPFSLWSVGIITAICIIHCEFEAFIINIFFYVLTVATPVFLTLKIVEAYCQHSILKTKSCACLLFFFRCFTSPSNTVSYTPANYNPAQIILYLPLLTKFVVLQLLIWMTIIYNHWCQS